MPRPSIACFALALLCIPVSSYGQAPAPVPDAVTESLLPADAQRALRELIPKGKKFVPIDAYVAGTRVKDVDLGMSCSSSSSGSVKGNVDDDGNVNGTVRSNGSSDCSERYVHYHTLMLGLPNPDEPNSVYFVTAECVVKWIWDHCDMPSQHVTYPIILELEKKGTFNIYAATEQRLGGKIKAARFAVLSVKRLRVKDQLPPSPH